MPDLAKSTEQTQFEARVRKAECEVAILLPDQLELVDLIAKDLFSSGHPAGWSENDKRHWDDLDDAPIFTRGQNTFPAKLQWRIKAIRVFKIVDAWITAKRLNPPGTETVN